jgi:hypothetical protein
MRRLRSISLLCNSGLDLAMDATTKGLHIAQPHTTDGADSLANNLSYRIRQTRCQPLLLPPLEESLA